MKCKHCGKDFKCTVYCNEKKDPCECFNCYIKRIPEYCKDKEDYLFTVIKNNLRCKWRIRINKNKLESIYLAYEL
jgi:hypothetical protein